MKNAVILVLLAVVALGCSKPTPPPASKPAEAEKSTAAKAAEAVGGVQGVTMSGIKLFLYDKGPGIEGVARRPVLRIEADTFTSTGDKQWAFEKAHAYMVSRKTQEEWQLEAGSGTLREDENAFLSGGVVATLGTMTVRLEDIAFETAEGAESKAAWSDKPATVEDPGMNLSASSVKLFPDDKRFELTEVAGEFRFTKETP